MQAEFLHVFSKLHLHCAWVRVISLPQQQWLALVAHPDGTWKGCTAKPLQGAEIAPSSKTPLGELSGPGHAVLPTWGWSVMCLGLWRMGLMGQSSESAPSYLGALQMQWEN